MSDRKFEKHFPRPVALYNGKLKQLGAQCTRVTGAGTIMPFDTAIFQVLCMQYPRSYLDDVFSKDNTLTTLLD